MDLKDKLDLLWKYLFLAVAVAFVVLLFVNRAGYRDHFPRDFVGKPHMGKDYGKEIKVVKKITNGDTTVVVWVDGKQVDNPEKYLKKIKYEGKSGDKHIMKWKDEHGKKAKKTRVKVEKEED